MSDLPPPPPPPPPSLPSLPERSEKDEPGKISTAFEVAAAAIIFVSSTAVLSARMPVYIAVFPAAVATIVMLMFFG